MPDLCVDLLELAVTGLNAGLLVLSCGFIVVLFGLVFVAPHCTLDCSLRWFLAVARLIYSYFSV